MTKKSMKKTYIFGLLGAVIFGLLLLVTLGTYLAIMGAILGWYVGSLIPDLIMD